ncbi:MAG: hypothetical protein GY941_27940 [Planctomycetes bacterium]|nr:hypothetical protein [Planctomycetota bacterium]
MKFKTASKLVLFLGTINNNMTKITTILTLIFITASTLAYSRNETPHIPDVFKDSISSASHMICDFDAGTRLYGKEQYSNVKAEALLGCLNPGDDSGVEDSTYHYGVLNHGNR